MRGGYGSGCDCYLVEKLENGEVKVREGSKENGRDLE